MIPQSLLRIQAVFPGLLIVLALGSPLSAQDDELLSHERLSHIPEYERLAWEHYLARSQQSAQRDFAFMQTELDSLGRSHWSQAPRSRASLFPDDRTRAWFGGQEAQRVADIVLSFQTPTGGWSKNVDYTRRPRQPGESFYSEASWSYIGTFDNDATTEQMRFLGKAYDAHGDDRYKAAFLRGLSYIFEAQFPNGCWPQVYPLQGSYHDAATFNDEAIPNILQLLRRVSQGEFELVPPALRSRAEQSMWHGVDCVLEAQVVVDGQRTVWGQQHDPLTLVPTQGRAYEHASLTAGESVDVVEFLMGISEPSQRIVEAVHAAMQWFEAVALHDLDYEHPRLIRRQGAGPIWARFYELGSNRPIFSNRDGVILYDWHELDDERRRGYAWFRHSPATLLRNYEEWKRRVQ